MNGHFLAECIPEVDCVCDDAKNNTFSCVRRIKLGKIQIFNSNLLFSYFIINLNVSIKKYLLNNNSIIPNATEFVISYFAEMNFMFDCNVRTDFSSKKV